MRDRVLPRIKDAKRRDRVRDLRGYMLNNAGSVVFPRSSMGAMGGTNAHVGADRMKGRGMSWSRKGAEAMCLVRPERTQKPLAQIEPVALNWEFLIEISSSLTFAWHAEKFVAFKYESG